jgi:hypothetical protein
LDLHHLKEYHRDYVKIWIHPFSSLQPIKPPIWYQRLVLNSLIEPYYLKIWLFIPNFMSSQVVVYFHNELLEDVQMGLRSQQEVNRIIKQADLRQTMQTNDQEVVMYSHHVGDVWVGTLKQTLSFGLSKLI